MKSTSDTPDLPTQVGNDSFPAVAVSKAAAPVNFLQIKEEEADIGVLRVGKHDIHLAPGETARIQFPVRFGPLEEDVPVVFEPKEDGMWPEGLQVKECLSRIQAGSSSRIWVPVCNQPQQGMTLRKRTELGTIQLVQSVTLLLFEEKEDDSQRSMAEEASSGSYVTSSNYESR